MKKNKYKIGVIRYVTEEATSTNEAILQAEKKRLIKLEEIISCRKISK